MGSAHLGMSRGSLPAERSSFIGRREELAAVRHLVGQARLVTLVGAGGAGKTRLAIRVATDLRRSFPGGAVMADLVAVRDPALLAAHVAAAFDVRDVSGRWMLAGLTEVIASRPMLLVLDNCEHLRDACAVLADALLAACPRLRILATSREPLDLSGEALFVVPPLSTPPAAAGDREASRYEAVELLIDRARAASPTLRLTPHDDAVLGELCRRLDGLPLAIELAAVRLRTLTPADVLARIDDRLELLGRTGTAVTPRHRTLRSTLEWSHDLLTERERLLWRRAAVFAGPFDLRAAESVCADDDLPAADVLAVTSRLVDTCVLEVDRDHGEPLFRMLETVRAFGREMLAASGEAEAVRRRHHRWCAGLAAAASAQFLGPGQVAAFNRLEVHHAELAAVVDHCVATPAEHQEGLELVADLWLYWQARGHLGAVRRWLDALLDGGRHTSEARARGLAVSGFLALGALDLETAVARLQAARDLATATGDRMVGTFATQYLGQAALFSGDLVRADALLREAARGYRDVDPRFYPFCLADVGMVAWVAGSYAAAAAALEESLAHDAAGDPWTRAHALWGLSLVRLRSAQPDEATALGRAALEIMRGVDDHSGLARCVEGLAWAAAVRCDWEHAARLGGAAEALWASIPAEIPTPLSVDHDAFTADMRRALGESRWSALHREGARLQRAQAVALALALEPPAAERRGTSDQPGHAQPTPLTRRQTEVAGLVAQGLTDREIAARLVISPRTAEYHVEQILSRLSLRSRVEIAAVTAAQRSHTAAAVEPD